jgi:hypothetical protein
VISSGPNTVVLALTTHDRLRLLACAEHSLCT